MLADRFAPLKNIESFTNEMFNRIIAFQEKEHAAWNSELDFTARIKGLPLHNLIFSNPDRDPMQYGPTIAPYYPLREEMVKLAAYITQVASQPLIYDWYPGNGFLGSLLAREGVSVKGVSNNNFKDNQIAQFYDASCYDFIDSQQLQSPCDAVFASWIPPQHNPTPDILTLQPKLIIYVYTEHVDPNSGQRQTGTDDMFDALQNSYHLLDSWSITRPKDLLHEVWPDMTPSIEETRITRVYAVNDLPLQKLTLQTQATPYDWEAELQMALLALEAKQELRSRGIRV